jgi:hypothetical protein
MRHDMHGVANRAQFGDGGIGRELVRERDDRDAVSGVRESADDLVRADADWGGEVREDVEDAKYRVHRREL